MQVQIRVSTGVDNRRVVAQILYEANFSGTFRCIKGDGRTIWVKAECENLYEIFVNNKHLRSLAVPTGTIKP